MVSTVLKQAETNVVMHNGETQWLTLALDEDGLPYEDGEPMESSWHRKAALILEAGYMAAHGDMDDYFIGCNMFVHFSTNGNMFRGPDLFVVKGVDGQKHRLNWVVWREGGRFPDLIIELLSPSTAHYDLHGKKDLYEQIFKTHEYICIEPQVAMLVGWRHNGVSYDPIPPDERGWLYSEEAGLWLGAWDGVFLAETHRWPRWYTDAGELVLTREERERQRADYEHRRADTERQRADDAERRLQELTERLAALEAQRNHTSEV